MTYRRKLYTGWQIGYEYKKKKSAERQIRNHRDSDGM
jgi:hypothetical protein